MQSLKLLFITEWISDISRAYANANAVEYEKFLDKICYSKDFKSEKRSSLKLHNFDFCAKNIDVGNLFFEHFYQLLQISKHHLCEA